MRNLSNKTKIATLGVAIGLIATAGGAFAWWSNSGNGTAGAVSAASGPVVSAYTAGGALVPGTMTAIEVLVTNPLSQPIIVNQFHAGTSQAFTNPGYSGGYSADCPEGAVVTLASADEPGGLTQTDLVTIEIPAGGAGIFNVWASMSDPPRDADPVIDAANNRDACTASNFNINLDFDWEPVAI